MNDNSVSPAITDDPRQAFYLQHRGTRCPSCQSHDIDAMGDVYDVEVNECGQDVRCQACGAQWRDVFRLVAFADFRPLAVPPTRFPSHEES